MKKTLTGLVIATLSSSVLADSTSPQIDYLTGDSRTACEVILCLSSAQGKGISECKAPLRKYFSIKARKWHKTLQKRRAFLDLCPAANENAKMSALTTAIQHQEYACDAETLNSRTETRTRWVSDDEGKHRRVVRTYRTQSYMPKFCEDLYNHEFTEYHQIKKPKYTCDGKWYSKYDWDRGFTRVVVSKKYNRRSDDYDYQYKDVPIKKQCWE
ncbi:TrbM/KikA/MpfK family conjugal transfer protein [Pasteurella multocida]